MTKMESDQTKDVQSLEETLQIIRDYHQLNFSHCLKIILADRGISIAHLHESLMRKDYYISLESLYRYFNPSPKSNRYPPQDFVQIFAHILQLTEEEAKILLLFWKHWQFVKKCNCL